jgi:glutamyl-tRNA(Gln) amidotransferase subunit D
LYSEKVQKILARVGIEIGDRVELASERFRLVGELMPRPDLGNEDALVIKLDNGYNAGIEWNPKTVLKLVEKGSGMPRFPRTEARQDESLPAVAIVYTGGTIGSKVDYKTGGVHPLIEAGELLYEVPELSGIANLSIRQLFSVWSEDMSYREWQAMAKEVENAISGGARGVVITMGTDTMHYAAATLSFMLSGLNAPVVITGAQRSSDRGSSDAFFNLSCAVRIAASSDIAEVGICMHDSSSDDKCAFIRGTKARKMHTSRRDAFRPINDRPIAYVDRQLKVTYNNDYNRVVDGPKKKLVLKTGFEPKVALIKSHPNSDPGVLDFYIEKDYKGLIIEGTGLGNIPGSPTHPELSWLGKVASAVEKGMVVGITSQCIYGRVNENVYSRMRTISGLGALYCEDMTPETAYVKLGWLLGNHKAGEAKRLLQINIAGEIKPRTKTGEFLI